MSRVAPEIPDRRLRYIDTLRAIAALLVLWRHVADVYVHADPSGAAGGRWLHSFADSIDLGRIGVVVFFLISGFVIPFSMHAGRPAVIGSFLIKRFFRIFPAYWLSIPLGALTGFWIWGSPFSARDFVINLTLLQSVVGARSAEGLYWTLLAEWTFYVLCIVLLLTNSLANMRRVCALAAALGIAQALAEVTRWAGIPLLSANVSVACLYLSIMLCGTLYRSCVVEGAARHAPWLRAGVYAVFIGYLVVLPATGYWAFGFEHDVWIPCALGVALFIAGTSGLRVATRLTDRLGQISYSIYLFNPVVFMALWWWLSQQSATSWWRTLHLGIYLLVNAGLTIALAALVYRYVEKPCIRLGHRYAEQWVRHAQKRRIGAEASTATSVAVSEPIARLPD